MLARRLGARSGQTCANLRTPKPDMAQSVRLSCLLSGFVLPKIMNNFKAVWDRFYPNCVPLNYELKHAEPDRWLRFHYPVAAEENNQRAQDISLALTVMNTVASEVLGDLAECWMSGPLYSPNDLSYANQLAVIQRWHMSKACHLQMPDDEDNLDMHAALVTWHAGRFNDVLELIENDEVRVMWMNASTGAVFAPYDRGVDLILPSVADVTRLAYQHSEWLSSYPGGW